MIHTPVFALELLGNSPVSPSVLLHRRAAGDVVKFYPLRSHRFLRRALPDVLAHSFQFEFSREATACRPLAHTAPPDGILSRQTGAASNLGKTRALGRDGKVQDRLTGFACAGLVCSGGGVWSATVSSVNP